MRAIVINKPGGVEVLEYKTNFPKPKLQGRDLLVKVNISFSLFFKKTPPSLILPKNSAIATNPIDFKVRKSNSKENRIVGWDACGVVEDVGFV